MSIPCLTVPETIDTDSPSCPENSEYYHITIRFTSCLMVRKFKKGKLDIPSKFIGIYTKAKRRPTSSFVKVYSGVPLVTIRKSLSTNSSKRMYEELK